jgi:hypothetical protein
LKVDICPDTKTKANPEHNHQRPLCDLHSRKYSPMRFMNSGIAAKQWWLVEKLGTALKN